MGFSDAVKSLYSNYVKFDGRSSRSEYWWAYLYFIIIYIVVVAAGALLGDLIGSIVALVASLALLATFIPMIAVAIRRLHDVDKSGWFYLLSFVPIANFYLLYLLIIKGTDGPNRFGPDPLGHEADIFS